MRIKNNIRNTITCHIAYKCSKSSNFFIGIWSTFNFRGIKNQLFDAITIIQSIISASNKDRLESITKPILNVQNNSLHNIFQSKNVAKAD